MIDNTKNNSNRHIYTFLVSLLTGVFAFFYTNNFRFPHNTPWTWSDFLATKEMATQNILKTLHHVIFEVDAVHGLYYLTMNLMAHIFGNNFGTSLIFVCLFNSLIICFISYFIIKICKILSCNLIFGYFASFLFVLSPIGASTFQYRNWYIPILLMLITVYFLLNKKFNYYCFFLTLTIYFVGFACFSIIPFLIYAYLNKSKEIANKTCISFVLSIPLFILMFLQKNAVSWIKFVPISHFNKFLLFIVPLTIVALIGLYFFRNNTFILMFLLTYVPPIFLYLIQFIKLYFFANRYITYVTPYPFILFVVLIHRFYIKKFKNQNKR
jgi:hypothetical protein